MRKRLFLVALVFALINSLEVFGATYYDNETDLLAAAPTPLNIESFETLLVDNVVSQHKALNLADFTLTAEDFSLSTHNVPNNGVFATDGAVYVRNTNDLSLTFTFTEAQNVFGLNITDWGDRSEPGTLNFSTNVTGTVDIATGTQPDGTHLFYGIINDMAFNEVVLSVTVDSQDSWAIDEIYYSVPEPCTLLFLGVGSMAVWRRKRSNC